jgi:myosin-5
VDDLTTLSYMHDPAILHALHLRYRLDMIYSYAGPILIARTHHPSLLLSFLSFFFSPVSSHATWCGAVNPYKDLGGLYSKEMMDAYVGQAQGNLSPHVFAIAEEAFRTMRMDRSNQSILVSGESGPYHTSPYLVGVHGRMAVG